MIKKNLELSIVVPCFNEEDNIKIFFDTMQKALKNLKISHYEYIFIDDGSKDFTWKKIIEINKKFKGTVTGIKLSKNFGHQNAITSSFEYCKGKYILFIDADLQDPPYLLIDMYKLIKAKKANVVYCQRNKTEENIFKKISSKIFYYLFNLLSYTKIPNDVSDFRLIDRNVLNVLKNIKEQDPFLRGAISWAGFKQEKIIFNRKIRKKGKSGWSLKKMFNFSLNAIFGFSNYPMRLSFIICFILILVFLTLGLNALYTYMNGENLKGWTSIFLVIILFNIFNFFILGLISEYTGRIYLEVKKRPRFIIENKVE